MNEFRPINLGNVVFKLITKTIANRLKDILPSIVNETQSTFILDRAIIDNVIIALNVFIT